MGTKNNPGKYDCYESAGPDEPIFVLLARDEEAAALVRDWAYRRLGLAHPMPERVREALACADAMDVWRKENR